MRNQSLRGVLICVVAGFISACSADTTLSPDLEKSPTSSSLEFTPIRPNNRPPFGGGRLDAIEQNLNLCEDAEAMRDSAGRFDRWAYSRRTVTLRDDQTNGDPERYTVFHFDDKGKQTHRSECILRRGVSADRFAREYKQGGGSSAGIATNVLIARSIGQGTQCDVTPIADPALLLADG